MERRTVLRAGAVAWTAPAIAAATAAPAFACSPAGSLTITAFTANYVNHLNAATVDPTQISVSSGAHNGGSLATTSYTRTLTIPGGLFDSVSSTTPGGYGAPVVTGNLAAGYTLTYTRSAMLAAGANDAFAVTLTVGNTSASPFRGWQGQAFTLGGTVNGGAACGTVDADDLVEATPNTTLDFGSWQAGRSGNDLWIGDSDAGGTSPTFVENIGRKAVGPITLAVTVPDVNGRYRAVAPGPPLDVSAGWEFVSRTGTDTAGPWTYTFRTTGDWLAPDPLAGGTLDQTPRFRARVVLAGGTANPGGSEPSTVNITAVASAPGANISGTASNNAE